MNTDNINGKYLSTEKSMSEYVLKLKVAISNFLCNAANVLSTVKSSYLLWLFLQTIKNIDPVRNLTHGVNFAARPFQHVVNLHRSTR